MGNCNNGKDRYKEGNENGPVAEIGGKPLHQGPILSLSKGWNDRAHHNEGSPLLACSDDGQVSLNILDDSSQRRLNNSIYCQGHARAVNRVVSSMRYAWSVSRDLSLRQWDLFNGSSISSWNDIHSLNITSVGVSNDERVVFTGSRDYHVKGFDVESKAMTHQFSSPRNIVTFLDYSRIVNDKELIVQGSEDLCVRCWDPRTGGSSSVPSMHLTDYVYFPLCGSVDSSGNLLATGTKGFNSVGCEVKIWDLRACKVLHSFSGHEHDVVACQFVPLLDGKAIISTSKDGKICVWDVNNQKLLSSIAEDKIYTSISVDQQSTNKSISIAAAAFDGSISFYNIDEKSFHPLFQTPAHQFASTSAMAVDENVLRTSKEFVEANCLQYSSAVSHRYEQHEGNMGPTI